MKNLTFMSSPLTFYLKGKIEISRNSVFLSNPNTILGIIPFGSETHNLYVDRIGSHMKSFGLNFKRFVVGVMAALMGLFYFYFLINAKGPKPVSGVICVSLIALVHIALAVYEVILSFYIKLEITNTSGECYHLDFLIFERGKAEEAYQLINEIIENRLNDTNVRMVAEAQVKTQAEMLIANNADLANQIAAALKEANK